MKKLLSLILALMLLLSPVCFGCAEETITLDFWDAPAMIFSSKSLRSRPPTPGIQN